MIQLQGSLRGMGLLPIVQLLADVRETGRLRVACGVLRGELAFDDGQLGAIPQLVASTNGTGQRVELERGSLQLLLAVNGERSVAEIIGDQPLLPTLRELGELLELGLISFHPPPARPAA